MSADDRDTPPSGVKTREPKLGNVGRSNAKASDAQMPEPRADKVAESVTLSAAASDLKHPAADATAVEGHRTVALLGTVAVGKSVIFDRMCSPKGRQNRPVAGAAVEVPTGRFHRSLFGSRTAEVQVIDTPGIYSLFSDGEDGMVTRQLLLDGQPDTVLQVLDAKSLRRSLVLALQLAEFGRPMAFVLNMMDMALSRGIEIDERALGARLGVEVQPTVASERRGLDDLAGQLQRAQAPSVTVTLPKPIEDSLQLLGRLLEGSAVPARALGLLLLGNEQQARSHVAERWGRGMLEQIDGLVASLQGELNRPLDVVITKAYSAAAERIVGEVQRVHRISPPFMERFGLWSQRLSTGIPIALCMLVVMYYFVGAFGATYLVDLINVKLFQGVLIPLFTDAASVIPSAFVRGALVDKDFGVLTTGLFLAFGIVLPVLFCFNLFFGLLEESGYLPRFSVLLHQALRFIGLTGKGVVPLVMGCSCVTMALLTTRMLDTRKEKIIASFLLILAMPCAPLIAVMFVILGRMPAYASIFVFGFLFVQVIIAGWLANKIIPGRPSELMLELPAMRLPRPRTIFSSAWWRTWAFMKEAVPWFLIASLVIFVINWLGGLKVVENGARPLMGGLLGLPDDAVRVFMKTVIRRESGAAELDHLRKHFTSLQLVVTLLVMTLLVPCVNSIVVLFKERGLKTTLALLGVSSAYALVAGGLIYHVCNALGVTFGG